MRNADQISVACRPQSMRLHWDMSRRLKCGRIFGGLGISAASFAHLHWNGPCGPGRCSGNGRNCAALIGLDYLYKEEALLAGRQSHQPEMATSNEKQSIAGTKVKRGMKARNCPCNDAP